MTLAPRSPLLIGTHTSQSNFRDTQFVIPGAVLRAAFARAICFHDGTKDPSADGIENDLPNDNGKGGTRFMKMRKGFTYLRFSALNTDIQPEPYPITTRKCKFNKEHKCVDILAEMIKNEKRESPERLLCPQCVGQPENNGLPEYNARGSQPWGGPLEKIGAYKRIQYFLSVKASPNSCRLITSTHSEIDKPRGTAKDRRLFTVRAIAPGAVSFHGTISGEIDLGELSILCKSPLRVGAMLTSGFGVCDMAFEPVPKAQAEPLTQGEAIKSRIKKFNWLIKTPKELDEGNGYLVPITLLSDVFISLKEPSDGDYINAYAPLVKDVCPELPFEMVRVITKPKIWRGFDTGKKQGDFGSGKKQGGFEKAARFLLPAGSVLVIRVDALDDQTVVKLLRLEREGIGAEKNDGYGAVRIAHERHIENALVLKGV
jgi:hypothetical protein